MLQEYIIALIFYGITILVFFFLGRLERGGEYEGQNFWCITESR